MITGDLCDPFMGDVRFRFQTHIEFGCFVYAQVGNYPLNFKVLLIDHTMQIEPSLTAHNAADYAASDLGFLLHKHSDHMRSRETSAGEIAVFYSERSQDRITAVKCLDVDPVGLLVGTNHNGDGLLVADVNDRSFVASLFVFDASQGIPSQMAKSELESTV